MCDECVRICNAIGELNAEEGNAVTIFAPNYSFTGASHAIEISCHWTGFDTKRYEGDTIIQALESAVTEKRLNT